MLTDVALIKNNIMMLSALKLFPKQNRYIAIYAGKQNDADVKIVKNY